MILGIGIDSVEITRFAHWHTYSKAQLLRIYSPTEIDYCLAHKKKSAERFAVRFAAREACFKALAQYEPCNGISFLRLCKFVEIQKDLHGAPMLCIDWQQLMVNAQQVGPQALISLTHTKQIATAYVLLQDVTL